MHGRPRGELALSIMSEWIARVQNTPIGSVDAKTSRVRQLTPTTVPSREEGSPWEEDDLQNTPIGLVDAKTPTTVPSREEGSPWTVEEDDLISFAHGLFDTRWSIMTPLLASGRTHNAIRCRFRYLERRALRGEAALSKRPTTHPPEPTTVKRQRTRPIAAKVAPKRHNTVVFKTTFPHSSVPFAKFAFPAVPRDSGGSPPKSKSSFDKYAC